MKFLQKILLSIFILIITINLQSHAQSQDDLDLAEAYYNNNEFEKAVALYDKMFQKNPNTTSIYEKYLKVLESLKQYDKAEKLIKKQLKNHPSDFTFTIDLAKLFELEGDIKKANEQYDNTIKQLAADPDAIRRLATLFANMNQIEKSTLIYEKGNKLLNSPHYFDLELATIYGKKGNVKKMMELLLNALDQTPEKIQEVKNILQPQLTNDDAATDLQTFLFKRIQKESNNLLMIDLLVWSYIQRKDFDQAITQIIAIDKRLKEGGERVLPIAQSAFDEEFYDAAINGYKYVADLGDNYPFYFQAKSWLLKTRKAKVINSDNYTNADLQFLKTEYLNYIKQFNAGGNRQNYYASTVCDLANLEALYFHKLDTAILVLKDLLQSQSLNLISMNKAKLDLGDYYLMNGDKWESTLLYSQVDKAMPGDALGEMAKFKNAKWSYYFGDFEWAQSQMDVLKSSTSDVIANDALDLSVFIIENLGAGDDSLLNINAMKLFAKADLLTFQNKLDDAWKVYDSCRLIFKNSNLDDNIDFAQAKICVKRKQFEQAIKFYDNILLKFGDDILADDALFAKADLTENKLRNKTEAQKLYQDLLVKYPGSTFVNEARKRFRRLRGDKLEE